VGFNRLFYAERAGVSSGVGVGSARANRNRSDGGFCLEAENAICASTPSFD
jgi:hypothetical protein